MRQRSKEDLITVVMSTKDTRKEYLLAAVNSILEQSYRNIELIVIVDGGNDAEVLKSILDDRLRIIVHRNSMGLAVRLNEAIMCARGKYIARMDADDFSLPNRLKKQYKYMEKNPDIDICGTFARGFGDGHKKMIFPVLSSDYIKSELFFGNVLVHPTIMFRTSSVKKYAIMYDADFRYSQDYELWARISSVCSFAVIPSIELFYRIHKNQVSTDKKREQLDYYNKSLRANLQRLNVPEKQIEQMASTICSNFKSSQPEVFGLMDKLLALNNYSGLYDKGVYKSVTRRRVLVGLLKNDKSLSIKVSSAIKLMCPYIIRYVFNKALFIIKNVPILIRYHKLYVQLCRCK